MSYLQALTAPIHMSNQVRALFREPYCHFTAPQLLHHFSQRDSVLYFPIIDPVETERGKINYILHDDFEFNGEIHRNLSPMPWTRNPSQDREWLILLHKFYYSVGLGMSFADTQDRRFLLKWVELTDSWIRLVPLDFLPSDVAGRRIQNWIFAHYFFITKGNTEDLDPQFYLRFLSSLSQQVSFLCRNLTPARNHRTLELCSIFLAGVVFPELREASEWRDLAHRELIKNIQSDFLPDGVHCELSTDYHHLVLKNFLWIRRLAHLNHIIFPTVVDEIIQKALNFSLYAHKPDGFIPSLSDGDSRNFYELLEQGHQLYGHEELRYAALQGMGGIPPLARSKGFPDSGYYILRSGWGNGSEPYEDERYLIFDCGPLGAGNHGHFDLLNIEMAAYGQSLILDPGRYTYDESGDVNWRVRFRETAAHNTVLVDRKNQTRYVFDKTRFKIKGPQPDFILQTFVTQPGFDFLHGIARSHEYTVVHERKIFFVSPAYWIISDLLVAQESHTYDLLFHLSDRAWGKTSSVQVEQSLLVHAPHVILAQPRDRHITASIEEGAVSNTYGTKQVAPVVKYSCEATSICFHTVVYPYKHDRPDILVEQIPVFKEGSPCTADQASALCITLTQHGQTFYDYYFIKHTSLDGRYTAGTLTHEETVGFLRMDETGTIQFQHRVS